MLLLLLLLLRCSCFSCPRRGTMFDASCCVDQVTIGFTHSTLLLRHAFRHTSTLHCMNQRLAAGETCQQKAEEQ
jgi:hypothetical protein